MAAIGGLALTLDIPLIRLSHGEPWSVLMLRTGATLVAALAMWAIWQMVSRKPPRLIPGRAGLVVAALYGVSSVAFVTGVYNTSTANLVFILAFNTAFAAILSWIFLKERPPLATLATIAVMILGVLIIVSNSIGHGTWFGDLAALVSALVVAAAITVSRASGEDMGFSSLIGVVLPFAVAAAVVVTQTGYRIDAPWWIILDGAVVLPISFFCLAAAPRYISGGEVAMFYLLETVIAPIWVWAIFSEVPSLNSLIGGAILIAALAAHSLWQLLGKRRGMSDEAVHYPAE
jgi:drug/metabolite transporter (DMT)-like permease